MKALFVGVVLGFIPIVNVMANVDTMISIKNTHASYSNGGICSLAFDIQAPEYISELREMQFYATLLNNKGQAVDHLVADLSEFNEVGGKTYGTFYLESDAACEVFGESVLFNKVMVYFNDGRKAEDIVKTKKLIVDDFKPMKIMIGAIK